MRRLRPLIPVLLCLLTALAAVASATSRADVVVHCPNGQTSLHHVTFDTTTISGLDLLQRSDPTVETGAGGAVCRIDGVGCPPTECFCHCTGNGPCQFWSYWRWANGGWTSSTQGAGSATVADR